MNNTMTMGKMIRMIISFDTIFCRCSTNDTFCLTIHEDENIDDNADNAMILGGIAWHWITEDFCDYVHVKDGDSFK